MRGLRLLLVAVLAACGGPATATHAETTTAAQADDPCREPFDAVTPGACLIRPGMVIDTDDVIRVRLAGDTNETVDEVGVVVFGDLDGDGTEEAVAHMTSGPSLGPGVASDSVSADVFLRRGDHFERGVGFYDSTMAGDEGLHLVELRIERGVLFVRSRNCYEEDVCTCEGDGCCAEVETAQRLVDGGFQSVAALGRTIRERVCVEEE